MRKIIAVPSAAIVEGAGQSYVYRELSPGNFEQARIVIGGRERNYVGVLSGLDSRDRVVVDGVMLLKTY